MNKKTAKTLIMIISLITCGFLSIFLFNKITYEETTGDSDYSQKDCSDKEKQEINDSENAEIIIKDLILKEIEKHKSLQVIINAHEGKIIHSDNTIECKKIKCSLCDKNRQIADLMSENATIDKTTKNVLLNGETIVHFDNMTINGNDIYYNYSNQTLNTDKKTKYNHPNFNISAQQSRIDFKKNEINMSGGVKSEFLNCPTEDDCSN